MIPIYYFLIGAIILCVAVVFGMMPDSNFKALKERFAELIRCLLSWLF